MYSQEQSKNIEAHTEHRASAKFVGSYKKVIRIPHCYLNQI